MKKSLLILSTIFLFIDIGHCQLPYSGGKSYPICGGSSSTTSYNISTVYLSTATHRGSLFVNPIVLVSTTTGFTVYSSTISTIIIYDNVFQAVPQNNIQNAGQINLQITFEPKLYSYLTATTFPSQLSGSWTKTMSCGNTSYCYQGGWPSVYLPLGSNEVVIAFDLTYSSNSVSCSWTANNQSIVVFDQYINTPAINNLQTSVDMETMFNFQPAVISTSQFTLPQ